ncbi:hypothetical protein [Burkholderia sp. RF2-non_BP3]|nr:hypothetical protein [Burkholderia sp. RF2-non_BP3]
MKPLRAAFDGVVLLPILVCFVVLYFGLIVDGVAAGGSRHG